MMAMWLIQAKRFFRQIITRGFVCSGPTSAADPAVFTDPAFSLEFVFIPKIEENGGMVPDLRKGLLRHVSAFEVQKAARLNDTRVTDETETASTEASFRDGIQPVGFKNNLLSFRPSPLSQNAIVVGGTGGLEHQRGGFLLVVKPIEGFFVLGCIDGLIGDVFAAAGGNQQKNVMGDRSQVDGELLNGWNFGKIDLGDRGVDLKFDARRTGVFDATQCRIECTRNAAEPVMGFGPTAIEADADAPNASIRHFSGIGCIDEGSVGGHDHFEAFVRSVSGHIENVGTQQGLTARQDHDAGADSCDFIEKTETGGRIKFPGIGAVGGRSPAVDAGKVAVAGDFPGDEP